MDSRHAIVLFDGVCNLCNRSVRFIVKRDPAGRFKFAPLQSEVAKKFLGDDAQADDLGTLILLEDGVTYRRSSAILRIARGLRFPWPLAYYAFIWVPRFIRDALYNALARRRYQWFGRMDACPAPSAELSGRFIVDSMNPPRPCTTA